MTPPFLLASVIPDEPGRAGERSVLAYGIRPAKPNNMHSVKNRVLFYFTERRHTLGK